jgi:hypothetical protein
LEEWFQQKRRHLSVSPAYRPETRFRLGLEPLTRGLFYASFIASVVYDLLLGQDRIPVVMMAAVAMFLVRWIMQTLVINVSARRLGLHRFNMFSVLWFDIVLPLVSAWMLTVPKRQGKW